MSAWIVSKRHIDFIVSAAVAAGLAGKANACPEKEAFFKALAAEPHDEATRLVFADWCEEHDESYLATLLRAGISVVSDNADEIGRMLWRENLRSIKHRYGGGRPGAEDFRDVDVDRYTWTPSAVLVGVALDKTIGCYQYQSCEHPDWNLSVAFLLTAHLRPATIPDADVDSMRNDPVRQATPWGWEEGPEEDEAIRRLSLLGAVAGVKKAKRKPRNLIKPTVASMQETVATIAQFVDRKQKGRRP